MSPLDKELHNKSVPVLRVGNDMEIELFKVWGKKW